MGHSCYAIRIKYGKQGAGRYISHLDTIRAAERALRRLGLPLLYSEGFSPRPRMSFAAALMVGVSSQAEYMDVFLKQAVDAGMLAERGPGAFHDAMPMIAAGGFDGSYTLPSRVAEASYRIRPFGPASPHWSEERLASAVDKLISSSLALATGRDGKQKDVRGLIHGATAGEGELAVNLACGKENLRPQAFMEALAKASGEDYEAALDVCRTGLWLGDGGNLRDPLADCTDVRYAEKFRS